MRSVVCINSRLFFSAARKKLEVLKTQESGNSRKNSKLKPKFQFSGISEANKVSQSALKKSLDYIQTVLC